MFVIVFIILTDQRHFFSLVEDILQIYLGEDQYKCVYSTLEVQNTPIYDEGSLYDVYKPKFATG